MKKIMFYINAIDVGGAERVITNLASQFAVAGYDVVLVTSFRATGEYPLDSKVKRLSIEDEPKNQSRIARNLSRIIALRKICRIETPDLLVSFMGEPNFRAVVATIGLPVKTIISVRNDPNKEYDGKLMHFVGKHILPLANGCVFQTEEAMKWFPNKLQKKGRIIFNAVKSDFYKINREPKRNLIVSCGRLQPQKNHKLLIDAVDEIKDSFEGIQVKIYGEGPQEEELNKYIKDKGLENIVSLEGKTEKVPQVLSKAEIFVMTSNYEGMPNALLEAMAVGVPCISSDCPCGGPRILLGDNNGLLFPVGNVSALSAALKCLLEDDEKKKMYSANAKKVSNAFSTEVIFNSWKEYFIDICEK